MYDGFIGLYDEYVINLDERCFARLLKKMPLERAMEYANEHTDIIHFNGKYKPWKSGYKGVLDGYWHYYNRYNKSCNRMPILQPRRYYDETA